MQENNHLAIVDLAPGARHRRLLRRDGRRRPRSTRSRRTLGPQGAGLISLDGSLTDRRREPDTRAVDRRRHVRHRQRGRLRRRRRRSRAAVAASRSSTRPAGSAIESGAAFEHEIVRAGHYPEARSENKGNEPEGLEVGQIGGRTYLFVASERANVVGGLRRVAGRTPTFVQLLPTGIGPEGLHFDRRACSPSRRRPTAPTRASSPGRSSRCSSCSAARRPTRTSRAPTRAGCRSRGSRCRAWPADPADPQALWAVSDSVLAQAYALPHRRRPDRRP